MDSNQTPSSEAPQDKSQGLLGRVTDTLSQGIEKVKGLVSSNKEEVEKKTEEKVDEAKETINEWEKPLKHIDKSKVEEPEQPETQSTTASESQSLGEKLKGGISGLSSQISQTVENVKDKFRGKEGEELPKETSEESQSGQSLIGKIKEGYQAVADKLTKKSEGKEAEGFHKVEDGFSETVDELKKEQHGDEHYVSSNPFEPLGQEPTEEKRSLAEKIGDDITNKVQQIKEGLTGTTNKIC